MKLDSRILEGKKPLTCFDTEQAWQFIGKQCYFSDDARDFMDLDKADGDTLFYVAELQNIWTVEEYCFADNSNDWRYILPLEWVKEPEEKPEKKYRPYTLTEFVNTYSLGDEVIIRTKDNSTNRHVLFTEYEEGKGRDDVRLGQYWYTFMILFNNYELYIDGKWQPFGVEE